MDARVGDEIVVDGPHIGDERRKGEVLEVMQRGDVVHFRVRWDDGHETVFFPSADAHVVHLGRNRK
jgi:Domain of unknown function (DUF1918)